MNAETVTKDNFEIALSVDSNPIDFSVQQTDSISVLLTSETFKQLPELTTIVVKPKDITSLDGKSLQGITSVSRHS